MQQPTKLYTAEQSVVIGAIAIAFWAMLLTALGSVVSAFWNYLFALPLGLTPIPLIVGIGVAILVLVVVATLKRIFRK